MYVSELNVENFRLFGSREDAAVIPLRPGLNALIGENDSGKTAIIDAIKYALGARDQHTIPIQDDDFHVSVINTGSEADPNWKSVVAESIRIRCKFSDLSTEERGRFAEYLTYHGDEIVLYVNWVAKRNSDIPRFRRWAEVCCGEFAEGPSIIPEVRELLRITYLRPLRDAEGEMSAGRYSRLSQILQVLANIKEATDAEGRTILDIGDHATAAVESHPAVVASMQALDKILSTLAFNDDSLTTHISMSANSNDELRRRQLLEKLELELSADMEGLPSNRGLGSNNLLFMACEMLLLNGPSEEFPMMLIEEPEAHLHPQRQLRVMQFLQSQAKNFSIQVIATTHSPQLASVLRLNNSILVQDGNVFPLGPAHTRLDHSDYRFLERFLDATKANLFFARGVLIVEGDAENILIPTIARLIGMDLTAAGVSIVNVGHTGLHRYARIFQRSDGSDLKIPVACLLDLDVMPACAVEILGLDPTKDGRRWKSESDFGDDNPLSDFRENISAKISGGSVKGFVSSMWTFEYELAYSGLLDEVWRSACLSKSEGHPDSRRDELKLLAETDFEGDEAAVRATHCYSHFLNQQTEYAKGKSKASKSIAAQYLARFLSIRYRHKPDLLKSVIPVYLVEALEHVTGNSGT